MTPQTLIGLALQMPGAYEDHPFGPESVVIKVEGAFSRRFLRCAVWIPPR